MSQAGDLRTLALLPLAAQQLTLERDRQTPESDPLTSWQPHLKQQPFIESVLSATHWENYFIAANRAGKSESGAYCGAHLARFGAEPVRSAWSMGGRLEVRDRATSGWVVGLDFPILRDVIQPKYFDNGFVAPGAPAPFIPRRFISEWRQGDQILKLRNGSIVGFKSCESGTVKFSGAGKDWIHFDEEPPRAIFDEAVIRVEAGRRFRLFITCTLLPPEGFVGGVSWLFSEVIQPVQGGQTRDIGLFGASIYDNPHLDPEEIRRLESRYPEGSPQRRIRLGGEWLPGLAGARIYGNFSRLVHVRPQTLISPHRPLCWCLDFNVAPFCSVVGQKEPGLFRAVAEVVLDEGSAPEMVEAFRRAFPAHPHELWIYGDAAGANRTAQTGISDYQTVLNALRSYPSPVRLKVPAANPMVRDRINAANAALQDEHGASHVEIDPSCAELIADLEQVLSDGRGGIKKTTDRRDPYFRRTHTSDAWSYWVTFEAPVRRPQRRQEAARAPQAPRYGFQAPARAGYGGLR